MKKEMIAISQILKDCKKATTSDLSEASGIRKRYVRKVINSLIIEGCVSRGENTGRGRENYWLFESEFLGYDQPQKLEGRIDQNGFDWSLHYQQFSKMVGAWKSA
jgi:hypothetical protein